MVTAVPQPFSNTPIEITSLTGTTATAVTNGTASIPAGFGYHFQMSNGSWARLRQVNFQWITSSSGAGRSVSIAFIDNTASSNLTYIQPSGISQGCNNTWIYQWGQSLTQSTTNNTPVVPMGSEIIVPPNATMYIFDLANVTSTGTGLTDSIGSVTTLLVM